MKNTRLSDDICGSYVKKKTSWNKVASKEIMNWGPEYLFEHVWILKFSYKNSHRSWWIFFFTYNSISLIYNINHLM